ncbi:hypothetical protein RI367_004142 [Sorochytrium milnesiophthora]
MRSLLLTTLAIAAILGLLCPAVVVADYGAPIASMPGGFTAQQCLDPKRVARELGKLQLQIGRLIAMLETQAGSPGAAGAVPPYSGQQPPTAYGGQFPLTGAAPQQASDIAGYDASTSFGVGWSSYSGQQHYDQGERAFSGPGTKTGAEAGAVAHYSPGIGIR